MEQDTQPMNQPEVVRSAAAAGLPAVGAMLKDAISFMWRRYDLGLWYVLVSILVAIPMLLGVLVWGFLAAFGTVGTVFGGVVMAVLVIFTIALAIMNAGAVLYSATASEPDTYKAGWRWARSHIWALLWIQMLTGLVMMGGFVLLIIPGFIVAGYLMLSQVVLAREGLRGMAAMNRSWQLVKGRWWGVLGRVAAIVLVIILISAVVEVVALGNEAAAGILSFIISGFTTIAMMRAIGLIYQGCVTTEPAYAPASTTLYKILGLVGVVAIVVSMIGVSVAALTALDNLPEQAFEEGLEIGI